MKVLVLCHLRMGTAAPTRPGRLMLTNSEGNR